MPHRDEHAREEENARRTPGSLSSGNVFADLGLEDAETELVKADLVLAIGTLIAQRGLSQRSAARLLDTTQPKVSLLLRGHTEDVSVSKLMEHLNNLAHDVMIQITPAADAGRRGVTKVIYLGERAAARRLASTVRRVADPVTSWPKKPAHRRLVAAKRAFGVVVHQRGEVRAEGSGQTAVRVRPKTKPSRPAGSSANAGGGHGRGSRQTPKGRHR